MHRPRFVFGLLGLVALLPSLTAADPADTNRRELEELRATNSHRFGRPRHVSLTSDGRAVFFLRSGPRDPVLHLYAHDVATDTEREILAPAALEAPAPESISLADRVRRERLRDVYAGIPDYEFMEDSDRLLVPHAGRLFLVDRFTGAVERLPGESWIDPQLSHDERFLAAVRERELHVIDLATGSVRQLTAGATDTLSHGLAEFAALEEMDRYSGFWWSPDGTTILCQETDESAVELHTIGDPAQPAGTPELQRYPRAGTPLARVRLHLIPREGGAAIAVRWEEAKFPYLARVNWWSSRAPLTLLVQNRAQTEELLLAVDPATGATSELLREIDPDWLNLDERNSLPRWVDNAEAFLWTTERRGAWQLELRQRDGSFAHEITPVDFGYAGILSTHRTGWWFIAGTTDPREMHVWRFPRAGGHGHALTAAPGMHRLGWFAANDRRLRTTDTPDGAHTVEVVDGTGKLLATLGSRAIPPARPPRLELTRTTGERPCDVAIVRPHDFEPGRKYPVLVEVYGGPGHKMVTADGSDYFEAQAYANHGYIVVRIDGRGTPLRGRAWERTLRGNLIDAPLDDQVAALQELAARHPEIDRTRVGIWGSSYGGYVSAMATLRRPDIFRCGVAIAPVVTWENYDAHYTERYLGQPQDEPEAYRRSNVTTYAAQLTRPFLLVHGIRDDNVHLQHSLQLVDALRQAGRTCEFLPHDGTHVSGNATARLELDGRMLAFFHRHLQGPAAPATR